MNSKQVYCGLPHGDGVPHPPNVRCARLYLKERGQYIFELKHGLPFTSTGFLRGVVSSEGCGHPHKASVSGGIRVNYKGLKIKNKKKPQLNRPYRTPKVISKRI